MPDHDDKQDQERPDTALGEILREAEDAETDVVGSRERRHRGEAGDTITPSTHAQEEARTDTEEKRKDT